MDRLEVDVHQGRLDERRERPIVQELLPGAEAVHERFGRWRHVRGVLERAAWRSDPVLRLTELAGGRVAAAHARHQTGVACGRAAMTAAGSQTFDPCRARPRSWRPRGDRPTALDGGTARPRAARPGRLRSIRLDSTASRHERAAGDVGLRSRLPSPARRPMAGPPRRGGTRGRSTRGAEAAAQEDRPSIHRRTDPAVVWLTPLGGVVSLICGGVTMVAHY